MTVERAGMRTFKDADVSRETRRHKQQHASMRGGTFIIGEGTYAKGITKAL
jgi:hypothetical protein